MRHKNYNPYAGNPKAESLQPFLNAPTYFKTQTGFEEIDRRSGGTLRKVETGVTQ